MELQGHIVTKPKLLLLIAQQANKSGEELLQQGITILMGKLADREYGRLASQKSTLPQSEFGLLLYTRGGRGRGHCGTDQWLSEAAAARACLSGLTP